MFEVMSYVVELEILIGVERPPTLKTLETTEYFQSLCCNGPY